MNQGFDSPRGYQINLTRNRGSLPGLFLAGKTLYFARGSLSGRPPPDQNGLQPNDPHPPPDWLPDGFPPALEPPEKAEKSFSILPDPQEGQFTLVLSEITSSSNSFSQSEHLYSNIGILFSRVFSSAFVIYRWFFLFMPVPGIAYFTHSGRNSDFRQDELHYKDPGREKEQYSQQVVHFSFSSIS